MKRKNNGIELNFQITDSQQRTELVQNIINEFNEQGKTLSDQDFDLLTNYIACGVDPGAEKSPVQLKEIYLEGQPASKKEESLDSLLEIPTFNESVQFNRTGIRYKIPKPNFNLLKDRLRAILPESELSEFNQLWERINRLERTIAIKTGKNVNPPPTQKELEKSERITPYRLYQLKKLLLELRKEQYTLSDQFLPQLQRHELIQSVYRGGEVEKDIQWGNGFYEIAPLGLYSAKSPIFTEPYKLTTRAFEAAKNPQTVIDFRNSDHVYYLIEFQERLLDSVGEDCESLIPQIYETLRFYCDKAYLSEEQKDILKLKINHFTNSYIQKYVNQKYGTGHSESYISTIYTKQICESISNAAILHYDTYQARGQLNRFKKCKDCGEILLLDYRNFTKQSRSRDGFQCRCKRCEKKKRLGIV